MTLVRKSLFALLLGLCLSSPLLAAGLPELVAPEGLGVNIHFTDPQPGEMEMLSQAGCRWVRMDFAWGGIEREKGVYDFSAYDRLMEALDKHKIRPIFILDYSNRHYDEGLSPHSDEGRKAFARWAAAAVKHFRGRGILWEMYNEPNIEFWKPKPHVENYAKLALEVGEAIREAAPEELYVGPATSQIDLPFLEACFKAGLLEYWCAVTVHPYRQTTPETAAEEYARLRAMIARYAPKGKKIPIISGEWGYSAGWKNYDETIQGKMLPRQWLTNLSNDVPISIWYDWHDDGLDPKEPEHHFGTVHHPYHAGRDPVYDPKPAYLAAKTLTKALGGFAFSKRLMVGGAEDYVLLFAKGNEARLAAWTTSAKPRQVVAPASPGSFRVLSHTGEQLPVVKADSKGLALTLTDCPQYLVPEGGNELLQVAAAWQRVPLERTMPAQRGASIALKLTNPLSRPIRVTSGGEQPLGLQPGESATFATRFDLQRIETPLVLRPELEVSGIGRLVQATRIVAENPLRVTFGPMTGRQIAVRVENPSGESFRGTVRLAEARGLRPKSDSATLVLEQGQKQADVVLSLEAAMENEMRLGLRIEDGQGAEQFSLPAVSLRLVDDFSRHSPENIDAAWQAIPDGDSKVSSKQSLTVTAAPPGLPGGEEVKALKLSYQMAEGWKFIQLVPRTDALKKIEGRPKALGVWLHGDASKNSPRLRFTDSSGQTFQPSGDSITWKGWRYVVFPLDGADAGHWGGPDDGVVRGPIHWSAVMLIDGMRHATGPNDIYLAAPVLIY